MSEPEAGAECGSAARSDLCEGRPKPRGEGVPTAIVDQAVALPWNRCICFEHTTGSSRIDWEPARVSCQVPASVVIQN
jgi:hypothetical protein